MAFDGIVTGAVARELNERLSMGKIEKIYQPEPDELLFHVHTKKGNVKLYATCSSNHARIHLTEQNPVNPPNPLPFCMLLRKHLQQGRIISITQPGAERIIEMKLETMDEMGFQVNKKLIFEIMGKHSNIILVDMNTGKIMDSIKRVSPDINRVRQILPGRTYEYPPSQNKIPYNEIDDFELTSVMLGFDDLAGERSDEAIAKRLMDNIQGISPVIARELAGRIISGDKLTAEILHSFENDSFTPCVYETPEKAPVDFHVVPLTLYSESYDRLAFDTLSDAIDYYFTHKESSNRVKQKSADLSKTVKAQLSRLYLKKKKLGEDIIKAEKSQVYRLYGELLMANIHNIKTGDKTAEIINYYDNQPVSIPLDVRYAPAKNAQIYFKKYSKARTALKEKAVQIQENDMDIEYLESVSAFIDNAATPDEVDAIRSELTELGYLRRRKTNAPQKKKKTKPLEYFTSDGFRLLVGRNNKENDQLTLKTAVSSDWWFHTKDIPGSHVILCSEKKELTETAIFEAAAAAAYYSKARSSENVPVDYTLVRHVKKPSGAKPGMVIFTNNKTVYVTPSVPANSLPDSQK